MVSEGGAISACVGGSTAAEGKRPPLPPPLPPRTPPRAAAPPRCVRIGPSPERWLCSPAPPPEPDAAALPSPSTGAIRLCFLKYGSLFANLLSSSLALSSVFSYSSSASPLPSSMSLSWFCAKNSLLTALCGPGAIILSAASRTTIGRPKDKSSMQHWQQFFSRAHVRQIPVDFEREVRSVFQVKTVNGRVHSLHSAE